MQKKAKHYDTAIAYSEGWPAILVGKMICANKLVWIHNDYAFEGARGGDKITDFSKFNKICCVSKATEKSFKKIYPQFMDKTVTIYNLVNSDFIIEQSKEYVDDKLFDTSWFTIISVGRICAQKQFYLIPDIAKELKSSGLVFRWYILGGGNEIEVNLLQSNILKCSVSDCVIMLGERVNPYKYLKKADLFVLTSLYESYPTVINEARILGIPIVANSIPPIYEMLAENEGIITSIQNMAKAIIELHADEMRYKAIRSTPFYNKNTSILEFFYKLVD